MTIRRNATNIVLQDTNTNEPSDSTACFVLKDNMPKIRNCVMFVHQTHTATFSYKYMEMKCGNSNEKRAGFCFYFAFRIRIVSASHAHCYGRSAVKCCDKIRAFDKCYLENVENCK